MCASDKGKQANKQVEAACVEVWMQGAVWSCVTCRGRYAMHQSMQKSFRDASEMHWKSAEFDMQGRTLTHLAQCLMTLCSQFSCQIGHSSAELSLNTTFNAKHFTESVPTHCFNFKGISLSPEFGLHACADYSTEIHGHK